MRQCSIRESERIRENSGQTLGDNDYKNGDSVGLRGIEIRDNNSSGYSVCGSIPWRSNSDMLSMQEERE